jgi:hypothetical protein
VSLTPEEKIELVADRYDPDLLVDLLELTSEGILRAFPEEFRGVWHKFSDIELDIEELRDADTQ